LTVAREPPTSTTIAYKPGKSIETAMHHVVTHIQEAVENRQLQLLYWILRELLTALHVT
jgi:hypothetical protein